MLGRTSLRDYQRSLSARLVSAGHNDTARKLGVIAGGRHWMLDMAETSEVLPVPAITPVPLTRAWLIGVAAIRGNLYTIVDLSAYTGGPAAPRHERTRVILLSDTLRLRCGILVDEVTGLFRDDQLTPVPESAPEPWSEGQYRDNQNRHWDFLPLGRLAGRNDFLEISN